MNTFKSYQFVFIVGCQRSGTTLLGNILANNNSIYLIDENDGLYNWIEPLLRENADLESTTHQFHQVCAKARNKYRNPDLWCSTEGTLNSRVSHIVLKGPNLTYYSKELKKYWPQAKIIFSIRDIRDIVSSMHDLSWIPMEENQRIRLETYKKKCTHPIEGDSPYPEYKQATILEKRAYIATIKTLCFHDFSITFDVLRVRYEDLVTDFEDQMNRLFSYLGLDPKNKPSETPLQGWGPGFTYRLRPIDSRSIGRWVNSLSQEDAENIWKRSKHAMTPFGYQFHTSYNQPDFALKSNAEPIICFGRGGSGTSLLSQIIRQNGYFLGNRLNRTGDSEELVDIIYKVAIAKLNDQNLAAFIPQIRKTAHIFLEQGGGPQNWGWKLPECTLILPELFQAFPKAKFIHLIRHPVDCCLRRTHVTSRLDNPVGKAVLKSAYSHIHQSFEPKDPFYIHNAVSWKYQMAQVISFLRNGISPDRFITLKFEHFFSNPENITANTGQFLENPDFFMDLKLDPSRKEKWSKEDPRVGEIWDICSEEASFFGYIHPSL